MDCAAANLEGKIAEYIANTSGIGTGSAESSLATDKASVSTMSFQNSVMAVPSGEAVACVPQVDRLRSVSGVMQENVCDPPSWTRHSVEQGC